MATEQRNLIDRDELKLAIKVNGVVDIDDFPTVDAVEVVRCCECWKEGTEECKMVHKDCLTGCLVAETKGTDFCSYGERRTDA
jgi:hypothetical protein